MKHIETDHETGREILRLTAQGWEPEAAAAHVARMAARNAQEAAGRDGSSEKVSGAVKRDRRTPERVQTPPEHDDLPAPQPQNEKRWQGMVEMVFRDHGWLCYHTYDSRRSEPGFPDLVCAHEQHGVFFAELKMPNGTISKHQRTWIDRLHDAGARVYVWKPDHWSEIQRVAQGGK